MKNKEEFKQYMTGLGELFDRTISKTLMDIYWKALGPFTDDVCEKAFNQLIVSSRFFPKPADFLEVIVGSNGDRALNAWLIVEKAVKTIGPYASVRFEDPVIHGVIDSLGGWEKFQDCTNSEWIWRQKEFITRYNAMSNKSEHPKYLPGIVEVKNGFKGFHEFIEEPVTVRQLESGKVQMIESPKEEIH